MGRGKRCKKRKKRRRKGGQGQEEGEKGTIEEVFVMIYRSMNIKSHIG